MREERKGHWRLTTAPSWTCVALLKRACHNTSNVTVEAKYSTIKAKHVHD